MRVKKLENRREIPMEIELDTVYGGWKNMKTPDDIELRVYYTGGEYQMECSLKDLIELYTYLSNGMDYNSKIFGTREGVHVAHSDDRVIIGGNKLSSDISEFEFELCSVILDVYKIKNGFDDGEYREKMIRNIFSNLED